MSDFFRPDAGTHTLPGVGEVAGFHGGHVGRLDAADAAPQLADGAHGGFRA